MKLTNTQNMKASKSGMTLLELTVVILVLLSLISILFIGARAWKRGSDRAASILTIRNSQQAVRSFSNMNGYNPGQSPTGGVAALVFGPGLFIENNPTTPAPGQSAHPAGGNNAYDYGAGGADQIPNIGVLYIVATGDDALDMNPKAGTFGDW
ncbi:hypothetical protein HZ994_16150 [Akkermansiaceae bacterium]|nr:hypothetical protein HZ994_16150 [Akkermansiaceae bacterium]